MSFKIENTQSRLLQDVAVFSYDIDEDLKIYRQQVGARFHTTDRACGLRRTGTGVLFGTQVDALISRRNHEDIIWKKVQ